MSEATFYTSIVLKITKFERFWIKACYPTKQMCDLREATQQKPKHIFTLKLEPMELENYNWA